MTLEAIHGRAGELAKFGPGRLLEARPSPAKAVSVAAATIVACIAATYWTFAEHRMSSRVRELAGSVLVDLGGLTIGVGGLAFSHHLLGLASPLADKISADVVGLALGAAGGYVPYRELGFPRDPPAPLPVAATAGTHACTRF